MHATGKHVLVNASELTGQRSGSEQIAATTTVIRRRWSIRSVRLPNDAAPHTASLPHTAPAPTRAVTMRVGTPDYASALKRLAALDSSDVPASPVLLAEVGGEARAASSLSNRAIIADPFQPTAPLVQLLLKWAEQVPGDGSPRLPGLRDAASTRAPRHRQTATSNPARQRF
jgi:hypothetical protein